MSKKNIYKHKYISKIQTCVYKHAYHVRIERTFKKRLNKALLKDREMWNSYVLECLIKDNLDTVNQH